MKVKELILLLDIELCAEAFTKFIESNSRQKQSLRLSQLETSSSQISVLISISQNQSPIADVKGGGNCCTGVSL